MSHHFFFAIITAFAYSTQILSVRIDDIDNPFSDSETAPALDDPSSAAAYEDTVRFETVIGTVVPTIFAFVVAIGLVGNLLVILVVCKNYQMQNSTNTLIINLALSDLLFLILCVPFTAADYALPTWIFWRAWCPILKYVQFVSAYASVWTLVLMSLDRFLAVVFPIQSFTLRSVKNTLVAILVLWLVILSINLPMLVVHDIHTYTFVGEERSTCLYVAQLTLNASEAEIQAYHFSFNAFGYVVPLGVACVFYVFMLRRLWFMPALGNNRMQEESIRAKRKVMLMVTGVVVTFAICWLPLNVCFFLTGLTYRQGEQPEGVVASMDFVIFQFAAQILAYSNSCLNPILYAFLSENFRKGFVKLFETCRCCRAMRRTWRRPAKLQISRSTDGINRNTFLTTIMREQVGLLSAAVGVQGKHLKPRLSL